MHVNSKFCFRDGLLFSPLWSGIVGLKTPVLGGGYIWDSSTENEIDFESFSIVMPMIQNFSVFV